MAKNPTPEQIVLRRRRPTARQKIEIQNKLLAAAAQSREARATLRAMLATRKLPHVWDGVRHLPPDSFVETVAAAFQESTDIPLDIPFFTAMSLVSSHLLGRDIMIDLRGQRINAALWTIVLGPSGSGKTFSAKRLLEITGANVPLIPDSASAAKWLESLSEHNGGLWLRDEIGQFMKSLELQHMAEIRGYLLQAYDGSTISRRTKRAPLVVERPRMSVLGYSVDETWYHCIKPEMMLDGLCQRFNFVVARARDEGLRAIYDLSGWSDRIRDQWARIEELPLHPVYHVSPDAVAAFEEAFRRLSISPSGQDLPGSFFRRILFSTLRYALVYHVLLRRTSDQIDAVDIGWAARLIERHLADAAKLLSQFGLGELETKVRRVEQLIATSRARGAVVTPRDVCRCVSDLRNVLEARALLELALESDRAASSEERRIAGGGRRFPRPASPTGSAGPSSLLPARDAHVAGLIDIDPELMSIPDRNRIEQKIVRTSDQQ